MTPRSFSLCSSAALFSAVVFVSASAIAAPKDKDAQKLSEDALMNDYLGTNFAAAEKKLKKALALCKGDACSPKVKAQLHRDLGVVYVAGLKDADEGKAQFAEAVKIDPSVKLDPDLTNPEIQAAFDAAKGGPGAGAAEEEDDETEAEEPDTSDADAAIAGESEEAEETPAKGGGMADIEECPPDFPGCEDPDAKPPDDAGAAPAAKNWLTLAVQQDFLFFSSAQQACSGNNDYTCFQGEQYYLDGVRAPLPTPGNEISGGLARATVRILLGYDRLFGSNLTAGARVGYAFGGGPAAPGGAAFVPLHVEVRAAYWFGTNPFSRAGFRPYVALGGGVSQVDAKLPVGVIESGTGQKVELDAWKKTGTSFAFLGGGAMYALTPKHGILLELKYLQMFGASSSGLAAQLGYGLGF